MRARNHTRPLAVNGVAGMVTFVAVGVPLMFALGFDGYIIGIASMASVHFATRTYYLSRLFPGFSVGRHLLRALAPCVPAVGMVLLVRALEAGFARTPAIAALELALYLSVTIAATMLLERPLLREATGYLRRRPHRLAAELGD